MMKFSIVAAAAAITAATAGAAPITTLYNTGVDNSGIATSGNGADLHWGLLPESLAYDGGTNGSFPIGPWIADSTTSRWVTPTANAADGNIDHSSDGIYTYATIFSLNKLKASTASFSGRFASDNTVDSIQLNGVTISGSGGSFDHWNSFSSAGGTFRAGYNLLTFTVRNYACSCNNPTGLRVEVSGTATAVPEAATWTMMIAGFGLVGIATRRRARPVIA